MGDSKMSALFGSVLRSPTRPFLRHTVYTRSKNKVLRCIAPRYVCSSPPEPAESFTFRTSESNPANHRQEHLTRYFQVDKAVLDQYLPLAFPAIFKRQAKTFNEACMMVRKPALEVIDSLRRTDYSKPPVRYVLYGKGGQGKTLSLAHVLQYCLAEDWMIVHVPNGLKFVFNSVYTASNYAKGTFDQPKLAQEWLTAFAATNETRIAGLSTQARRHLNLEEHVEAGTPFLEVIQLGMLKPERNASDVVRLLLEEVTELSSAGKFHLLVAVDYVNAFFNPRTALKRGKNMLKPEEMTLISSFVKLLQADSWHNGAVVTAVDGRAFYKPLPEQLQSLPPESQEFTVDLPGQWKMPAREGWLPMHLMSRRGLEVMHPYVPVLVEKYDRAELASCLRYYIDRKWIQNEKGLSEQGQKELTFLSDRNPNVLYKICGAYA